MSLSVQPAIPRAREARLDALREEAKRTGTVAERGIAIDGAPTPREPAVGYYGLPMVKPPVWTWQIGLYFFAGGAAGMSSVLALAGLLTGQPISFVTTALTVSTAGAIVSPMLLIADLGRPRRFLHMLRVFKWRSPMSVGAWTLVAFSTCAALALIVAAGASGLGAIGLPERPLHMALFVLVPAAALSGVVLATYTGVLLGATAIPAWSAHHRLLPVHFGIVGLGSAAAIMELLGYRLAPLNAIGLAAAAVETGIGAFIELGRKGPTARALREGRPGLLLRVSGVLTGPLSFLLRLAALIPFAAASFAIGAVISRYGWIWAGRASALDPGETIASQR